MFRINKEGLSMMSIIEHFLGTTEHFSGKNGALRWSIVGNKSIMFKGLHLILLLIKPGYIANIERKGNSLVLISTL